MCHTVTYELYHFFTSRHPHIDGWDTTKLEDLLSDIKMAADILQEGHACLAKAKSCSLTCTIICEALQAMKCLDDIRDKLHLKLCNANIPSYTSCFMEIQERDNNTLTAYVHHFKTEAKRCDFNSNTTTIHMFVEYFQDACNIMVKIYEKDPKTLL